MSKKQIFLGAKYTLDMGQHVTVIPKRVLADGIECEYVMSTPGRKELIRYNIWEMNGFDVNNSYSKDFKYTLQSKDGKILLQSIVTFGTKNQPFPKEWKEDGLAQIALQEYKEKFINENFDIVINEDLDFDI